MGHPVAHAEERGDLSASLRQHRRETLRREGLTTAAARVSDPVHLAHCAAAAGVGLEEGIYKIMACDRQAAAGFGNETTGEKEERETYGTLATFQDLFEGPSSNSSPSPVNKRARVLCQNHARGLSYAGSPADRLRSRRQKMSRNNLLKFT